MGDHPRGCGEHRYCWLKLQVRVGSSPRMRGAPLLARERPVSMGIIPADAGSTVWFILNAMLRTDHPRGCGEHISILPNMVSLAGSSPRMRGAHGLLDAHDGVAGIIPADAGSTSVRSGTGSWRRDHPRGCGEHTSDGSRPSAEHGSSPRMRGALSRD